MRFIVERNIEEVEPFPDEIEAIKSEEELIDIDGIKRKYMKKETKGGVV